MEGNMKVWIVAMAALLCWSSVTVESSRIFSGLQTTPDDYDHLNVLQASDLQFFIDDPTSEAYSKFLKTLRGLVTCYTLEKYHITVLCTESDLQGNRYTNVVLSYNSDKVTLALDVVNLDIVAYSSGTKSYFFANTVDLKDELFQGTDQVVMDVSNTYKSLGSRAAVGLGVTALQTAFGSLSTYETSTIKTSLITVIGMISEAARFKVIENAVKSDFTNDIKLNSKLISYEDNWGELSKNIQRATNGKFPSPVELKNENDVSVKVISVGQVQANMGILKYYPQIEANTNCLLKEA